MDENAYTFRYRPGAIHHGPGAVADLEAAIRDAGGSAALVVTGGTVSGTDAVMDPVRAGLGDALVGVYDGVTPEKYLKSAVEAATRARESDVDALVGLGGGSSLDVAKIASALLGHDRPPEAVAEEIVADGSMRVPEGGELTDVVAVPTTLPGADLSQVAGVTLALAPGDRSLGEIPSGGVSDPRLMPVAVFHDLDLFATTPTGVLATSAMNGFDKGVEMLYTRHHTPITDGTAIRGVRLLHEYLPSLAEEETSEEALSMVLRGIACTQYGVSTPGAYRASIIHAFGHALSRTYPIQQGAAHAIAAPHVLEYLFEQVDGRRALLAEAFDVRDESAGPEETAEAIVGAVAETRDALELPDRLRDVEDAERGQFPDLARAVVEDPFMEAAPRDLEAAPADIAAVFEAMW